MKVRCGNTLISYRICVLHAQPEHRRPDAHVIGQILHRPNGGHRRASIVNVLVRHLAHIISRHAVDALLQLVQRNATIVAQILAPDVLANRRGACTKKLITDNVDADA